MAGLVEFSFVETDIEKIAEATGRVAVIVGAEGKLDRAARRVNRLCRGGALARLIETDSWKKAKQGDVISLGYPSGLVTEALDVVKLDKRPSVKDARKAGGPHWPRFWARRGGCSCWRATRARRMRSSPVGAARIQL